MADNWISESELNESQKKLREIANHEDGLVNQRIMWTATLSGLMFTAYTFSIVAESSSLLALSADPDLKDSYERIATLIERFRFAIISVGILTAVAGYIGVGAAFSRIRDVANEFREITKNVDGSEESNKYSLIGSSYSNKMGMINGLLIPFSLIGAWIWVGGFTTAPWFIALGVMLAIATYIAWVSFKDKL